jgi:hypothetical protein
MVKVHCNEGVAIHIDPESCAGRLVEALNSEDADVSGAHYRHTMKGWIGADEFSA